MNICVNIWPTNRVKQKAWENLLYDLMILAIYFQWEARNNSLRNTSITTCMVCNFLHSNRIIVKTHIDICHHNSRGNTMVTSEKYKSAEDKLRSIHRDNYFAYELTTFWRDWCLQTKKLLTLTTKLMQKMVNSITIYAAGRYIYLV